MPDRFQRKYPDASPFDAADKRDARSDAARKLLLEAAIAELERLDITTGEDLQDVAGGLMVGLVQVLRGMSDRSDQSDAALRAGLAQLWPWAMDMARAADGLEPLNDA